MGRRATDLATPVPVLGVPALVGLRGYKTLAGEKNAGAPPPLPSLSWTQQCSIGVQTSPGVGKLPLIQAGATRPVNILFTPSVNNGTEASKLRCVEAKTKKEVTFKEVPTGTTEHQEAGRTNDKTNCCYARAIKTNPHLAGNLTKVTPKPKLSLRYTNGSVVDSDAIGGISVDGGDARPEKDSASLGRDQVKPVGGRGVEQSGDAVSTAVVQPFRTPPKICNQCGGKQSVPCGRDIMGWQKPIGARPEGIILNPGPIPPPTPTTTTTTTHVENLRDLQLSHPQQPQRVSPCVARGPSPAVGPPLVSPNARSKPNAPHPSCPVHSVHANSQGHSATPLHPQTQTQAPAVLHTKELTVTEAIIETRQRNANSGPLDRQPHTNKPSLPACISLPPQFAVATKANDPRGCSYRKWTETSNCIAARYKVSDDRAVHIAPSDTQLPSAAVLESTTSYMSTPPGPKNTPNTIQISTSRNSLHTDYKINVYTMGFKVPNTANDSITVKNNNIKNQECSDSSRSTNPMNLVNPPSKASLEMVMNTQNNANTAMRPKAFPGSILHLATTQVMDTLSSYKQNNTSLPVGTFMHIEAPTHTASHTTTVAKITTDLVPAITPFKHVGAPLGTNPSDSKTNAASKPLSNYYRAKLIQSLSSKPSPVTPKSPIMTTSNSHALSASALYKTIPLDEKNSSCAVSPSASPQLIEKARSGHQSHDVSPHTSRDGAHLTYVLNPDRSSHVHRARPAQTPPHTQTHSRNGSALESAVPIHHSSPTSDGHGLGGTAIERPEPLTLSEKTRLAADDPNSSLARKTDAQCLRAFPPNLLRNMTALPVSDQCMSNHTYAVNTAQPDPKVNSIIKSCFDLNKDKYKCIDSAVKQNSKPCQTSIFLKVTHLNYISQIKPQRCQSQTSMNTNEQQCLQLQSYTDRITEVQTTTQIQVRPSEEIQDPTTTEQCFPGPPARDDLETSADSDAHSLSSASPIRAPTNLCATPADATANSSFDEWTGELCRYGISDSDTLSSQLMCAHSSASSVLSQNTLDASERELCEHAPDGPTCGVKLQRPWTDLTALAHLRSRVRACRGSGRTLVHQGPEVCVAQAHAHAHAHPPDAEELLVPPSPRCSKTAALQWRLETVEASLEANRGRISTLLHIIQDLEQIHVSTATSTAG